MKRVYIFIFIMVIAIGGFFLYQKYKKLSHISQNDVINEQDNEADTIHVDIVPPEITQASQTSSTYLHKKYNFTFSFPSDFKTSNFQEGEGEQIVFTRSNGDWFQIYITPWDEGEILTSERIHEDIPDLVIRSPQNVILGPQQKKVAGQHALIFFSKNGSMGETREVWFVYHGNLYQVTTYKRLDSLIGQILSTLIFK